MELFASLGMVGLVAAVIFVLLLGYAASRLYVKSPSNKAFVRTGSGKAIVVLDGGKWVIPIIHEHRWVSLETMRIEVSRENQDALITADKLRADVAAEFYIRVEPDQENVLQASRSLGSKSITEKAVDALIAPKLVSALRTVAAQKSLMELHQNRDDFADAVNHIVKTELRANGLLLESVTISNLDASRFRHEDNYFDAQGVSHMTETLQEAARRKNEIERGTQESIAQKDVETRKKILLLEQEQQQAELQQQLEINRMTIEQKRLVESETATKQAQQEKVKIDQQRAVEEAEIQRNLSIENAKIASEVALIEKNREKQTADELAKVSVEKAKLKAEIEIVNQNKDKEISEAEARAQVILKEKQRLEMDAQREQAKQELLAVEQVQKAKRDAEIETIEARVEAQKQRIQQEMQIDVAATKVQKEAQAKFEASDLEAKAIERLAQAQLAKAEAEAEGERQMLEAKNLLGSNLLLQDLIKVLPDVTRELVAPVAKINDIKLINMGGANGHDAPGLGDTILKSTMLYPIIKEVAESNGIDVNQVIKSIAGKLGNGQPKAQEKTTATKTVVTKATPSATQVAKAKKVAAAKKPQADKKA